MELLRPGLAVIALAALNGPMLADRTSVETLAALDPTARLSAICGGSKDALRDRLKLAAHYGGAIEDLGPMPLLDGLPAVALHASTGNAEAQRYFAQGLMLAYGFNHQGAIRSFRAAQRLDPDCAICWWGEAMAHGPNINAPMAAGDRAPALAALRRAQALRGKAAPPEAALIDALATRYSDDPDADRGALDLAYADAMLKVAAQFPDLDDVQVLAAEAVMDTSPWNYWQPDGRTPNGRIGEAIRLVDTVLARNPEHIQAGHLQIHLYEASTMANHAEAASDRMATGLAPGAGHLVHMPAHIFYRLGRFADSIRVNAEAARADERYFAAAGDSGLYRFGYYPHNVHFLVTSAQMAGDMATALTESARLAKILQGSDPGPGWVQMIHAAPYLAHARFSAPSTILAQPEAPEALPLVRALRHHARAIAHAVQRDRKGFDAELAAMAKAATPESIAALEAEGVPAGAIVQLAAQVARGRFAMATGATNEAIGYFTAAAAIEDALPYTEPPFWYYPVQQSLGAALFKAGRYDAARTAFQAALASYPANGWALWGLAKAERALGHAPEADAAEAAFKRAWLGDPAWLKLERL